MRPSELPVHAWRAAGYRKPRLRQTIAGRVDRWPERAAASRSGYVMLACPPVRRFIPHARHRPACRRLRSLDRVTAERLGCASRAPRTAARRADTATRAARVDSQRRHPAPQQWQQLAQAQPRLVSSDGAGAEITLPRRREAQAHARTWRHRRRAGRAPRGLVPLVSSAPVPARDAATRTRARG